MDDFKHLPPGEKPSEKQMRCLLIRIGKYEEGESLKASLQVKDRVERPRFNMNCRLRVLQKELLDAIKPYIEEYEQVEDNEEKIKAVVDWINVPDLKERTLVHTQTRTAVRVVKVTTNQSRTLSRMLSRKLVVDTNRRPKKVG